MIVDTLENHSLYPLGAAWKRAFAFLQTLGPDTPEGRHEIDGDNLFAIVMTYETTTPQKGMLESHREYVDIQTVLEGSERFECAYAPSLETDIAYDASKDVRFYKTDMPRPVRVDVFPGTFVMLYPDDAHMAALMIADTPETIKKVVVKIRRTLL
jgi:YhcH/YjgK/YiaL family protein